jgi:hypothetical protein
MARHPHTAGYVRMRIRRRPADRRADTELHGDLRGTGRRDRVLGEARRSVLQAEAFLDRTT